MSTFKIAGKDFFQYIAYRLKKDKLGFVPVEKWGQGQTDGKSFIKSVVPNNVYDFLVYCHELGHCKSKQLSRSMGSSFFGYSVCDNTLRNEFNAWEWAARYLRRLKMEISKEDMQKALENSFITYARDADNKTLANDLIGALNAIFGTDVEYVSTKNKYDFLNDSLKLFISDTKVNPVVIKNRPSMYDKMFLDDMWTPIGDVTGIWGVPEPVAKSVLTVKPSTNKKHRPWMDLMDKQRKKSWNRK